MYSVLYLEPMDIRSISAGAQSSRSKVPLTKLAGAEPSRNFRMTHHKKFGFLFLKQTQYECTYRVGRITCSRLNSLQNLTR